MLIKQINGRYYVKYQGQVRCNAVLSEAIEAAVTASKRLKLLGNTNPSLFS